MNNSDKKRFLVILTGACEMYNKELTKTLLSMYFDTLSNFSIDDVSSGFSKHMIGDKGQYFPKPVDIIKHIKADEVPVEALAEMAWSEVAAKISSIGSYGNLQMEDKQALATVRALGGWKCICGKTIEQLVWTKKEFVSIYENYENTPVEMLPSELPGRIELEQHKASKSLASNIINKLTLESKK